MAILFLNKGQGGITMDAVVEKNLEKKLASITLGEGAEEQDDELAELIGLLRTVHECRRQAHKEKRTIKIIITSVPL